MKQTGQMPAGQIRALTEVATVDQDKRTIEVVWTTGARGLRNSWTGKYYEELSLDPKHLSLSRLKSGAPVLNTHSNWDLRDIIGVVEDAWIVSPTEARARLRMSDRDEVSGFVKDIFAGIIRNISVGYSIRKMVEVEREGDIPVLRAEDWEPFELSFVPVGFDAGAQSRSNSPDMENECTIILNERNLGMPPEMTEEQIRSQSAPAPAPAAPAVNVAEITQRAIESERTRVGEITKLIEKSGFERKYADELISGNKTIEEARAFVLDNLSLRDQKTASSPLIKAGDLDEKETLARSIEETLLVRAAPQFNKPTELSNQHRSATLLDLCRKFLEAQGVRTGTMGKNEIAGKALGYRGYHTTSDFPGILGNTVKKILKDNYATAPSDYQWMTRPVGLTDYKSISRFGLSTGPALLEVKEHGEYTRGSITEQQESMQLKKHGRIFAITRETIINDDLNAFNDVPRMWAFGAQQLQASLVWNQILSNPIMGDGIALFHANHGNLMTAGALNEANLEAAIQALETQKGFSAPGEDVQYLNIQAKYLVVGSALKYTAKRLTTQINPLDVDSVNLFSDLIVKSDPRLTGNQWYITADPAIYDAIGLMYMIGEEGPQLDERQGFDVDGVEYKVRLDTGAKMLDYRWIVKNPGL